MKGSNVLESSHLSQYLFNLVTHFLLPSLSGNVQRSAEIYMTAGHLYYVHALMAQGRGANHLSVGAKFPSGRYNRPLSNEYLLRYAPGKHEIHS